MEFPSVCDHPLDDAGCADCAPAPAAGHFGIARAAQLVRPPASDQGCPSLDEFEARFSLASAPARRPGTVSAH